MNYFVIKLFEDFEIQDNATRAEIKAAKTKKKAKSSDGDDNDDDDDVDKMDADDEDEDRYLDENAKSIDSLKFKMVRKSL